MNDNEAGEQPIVRPLFEEWARSDEKLDVIVTEERTTPEGRRLRVGDLITETEARRLRLPIERDKGSAR